MQVSNKLKKYIEDNIYPMYENNYLGDGLERINYVLKRSIDIIKENNLDINYDMLYVIISYHDLRKDNNEANHELTSANIMYTDSFLKEFFLSEELLIMKEAIEDQRANLASEPRSIYGKLLSSASRNSIINQCLKRSYLYGKKLNPSASDEELCERAYEALVKKFGINGYAKFYFKDTTYENFLKEIRTLLSNKDKFIEEQRKYIFENNLNN